MSLPSINFLHLTVSEIQAGQTFSHRLLAHLDTTGENNTPMALKGCGVKTSEKSTKNLLRLVNSDEWPTTVNEKDLMRVWVIIHQSNLRYTLM